MRAPPVMPATQGRVPVWDAAVRSTHWMLAALVIFNLVRDDGDAVHRWAGYVAAAVVLVRLSWACFAGGANGLRALRPSLSSTWIYLRKGAPRIFEHDPLGLWMVWLVWMLVLLLAISGWMSRLDAFWGDERVLTVHAWLAYGLLGAVIVHLSGVGVMSWRWRENLPLAMLTGKKRTP